MVGYQVYCIYTCRLPSGGRLGLKTARSVVTPHLYIGAQIMSGMQSSGTHAAFNKATDGPHFTCRPPSTWSVGWLKSLHCSKRAAMLHGDFGHLPLCNSPSCSRMVAPCTMRNPSKTHRYAASDSRTNNVQVRKRRTSRGGEVA
jgi:hypothetical protein